MNYKKIEKKVFNEVTEHCGAFGRDFQIIRHMSDEIIKVIKKEIKDSKK